RGRHGPRSGVQGRAAPHPRPPFPAGALPARALGVAQVERSSRDRRRVATDRQRAPQETGVSARSTCLYRGGQIRKSFAWGWVKIACEILFCASKWKEAFQNAALGGECQVHKAAAWRSFGAEWGQPRAWYQGDNSAKGCRSCGAECKPGRTLERVHHIFSGDG